MNSLLKMIVQNPHDKGLIFQLESEIKRSWKYFSPEKPFNYMAFSETFSELLIHIESNKVTKKSEVSRFFKNSYKKTYEALAVSITKIDGITHPEIIRRSKLLFKDFSPSDYLILFAFLNDKKAKKSTKILEILKKLRYNSRVDNESLINVINKCNFVSLYLIDEMGFKKYKEFTDLVDQLGMYYPLGQLPDSDVVLKIKDRILNKFMDSISNTNVDNISAIEKLIF